MIKKACLVIIILYSYNYCYAGYKRKIHLFSALMGACQGYINVDTGIRHIFYFFVGAYLFNPLCSYSIGHLCGSSYAQLQEKTCGNNNHSIANSI